MNKEFQDAGSGGSIVVLENDIQLDNGIFSKIYLALFSSVTPFWANNVFEINIDSQTEKSLTENSLDSTGKENIKRAVESDLSNLDFADFTVILTEINNDRLKIEIKAKNNGTLQIVWDFTESQIIEYKII